MLIIAPIPFKNICPVFSGVVLVVFVGVIVAIVSVAVVIVVVIIIIIIIRQEVFEQKYQFHTVNKINGGKQTKI